MKLDIIKEANKKGTVEELKDLVKDLASAYDHYDNDLFRNQANHKKEIEKLQREIVKYYEAKNPLGEFESFVRRFAVAYNKNLNASLKEKNDKHVGLMARALVKYYNDNFTP